MKKLLAIFAALLLLLAYGSFAASHYVTLTWTASADSTSSMTYNVYRGTAAGGESATPLATGVAQGCSGAACTYTDNNVTAGQTYFYQVAAVQGSSTSAMSNETSCTVPLAGPTGAACGAH